MYLIAIDYLEQRGVEPWRVREALRGSPSGSPATLLLARSQAAGGFLADSEVVH
jgi:predicted alpha-1,6-mannanase (GH76 family)